MSHLSLVSSSQTPKEASLPSSINTVLPFPFKEKVKKKKNKFYDLVRNSLSLNTEEKLRVLLHKHLNEFQISELSKVFLKERVKMESSLAETPSMRAFYELYELRQKRKNDWLKVNAELKREFKLVYSLDDEDEYMLLHKVGFKLRIQKEKKEELEGVNLETHTREPIHLYSIPANVERWLKSRIHHSVDDETQSLLLHHLFSNLKLNVSKLITICVQIHTLRNPDINRLIKNAKKQEKKLRSYLYSLLDEDLNDALTHYESYIAQVKTRRQECKHFMRYLNSLSLVKNDSLHNSSIKLNKPKPGSFIPQLIIGKEQTNEN